MKNKKYKVLIIGLGNIGLNYDFNIKSKKFIFSHTKAFKIHPYFEIVAGVDPDSKSRKKFLSLQPTAVVFNSIDEIPNGFLFDIIVISTPVHLHFKCIKKSIKLNPRLILLEKPISPQYSHDIAIYNLLKRKKIPCSVNYIRRADPGFKKLRYAIKKNKFGKLKAGSCYYSNGLLNNGSHYIDLLNFLLTPGSFLISHKNFSSTEKGGDKISLFTLKYKNAPITFIPVNSKNYGIGEIDLLFTNKRLKISDFGEKVDFFTTKTDPYFEKYKRLAHDKKYSDAFQTDLNRYQLNMVNELYAFLSKGAPLSSTIETALSTSILCEKILKKAK